MDPAALVGEVIDGRFTVLSVIGAGGMGGVVKARQSGLDRLVAIKFLQQSLLRDAESIVRFEREAQVLSSLSHQHVAAFYQYGIWKDKSGSEVPFIVMEYIEGPTLLSVLNSGNGLPWNRAVKIVAQLAGALQYLHNAGIVHRDLKPSNVLLLDTPESDYVKLLDFGLSKFLDTDSNGGKLTRTGELIGSVQYMSPEQCSGKKVDKRADIYSLGIVLYECIVGSLPHEADNPVGMIFKHMNEDAPEPSSRTKQELPSGLNEVVLKSLAKDPAMRYQTMEAFAHDLQKVAIGSGEEAEAFVTRPTTNKVRSGSKKMLLLSLAGIASLLLLVFAAVQVKHSEQPPSKTAAPNANEGWSAIVAGQRQLEAGDLNGAHENAKLALETYKKLNRAAFSAQEGRANLLLGEIAVERNQIPEAMDYFKQVLYLCKRRLVTGDQRAVLELECLPHMARYFDGRGDRQKAIKILREYLQGQASYSSVLTASLEESAQFRRRYHLMLVQLAELLDRDGNVGQSFPLYLRAINESAELYPGSCGQIRSRCFKQAMQMLVEHGKLKEARILVDVCRKTKSDPATQDKGGLPNEFVLLSLEAELKLLERKEREALKLMKDAASSVIAFPDRNYWLQTMEQIAILMHELKLDAQVHPFLAAEWQHLREVRKLEKIEDLMAFDFDFLERPDFLDISRELSNEILERARVAKDTVHTQQVLIYVSRHQMIARKYDDALRTLEEAAALGFDLPYGGEVAYGLMQIYYRQGKSDKILELIDKSVGAIKDINTKNGLTLYKGEVFKNRHDFVQAMKILDLVSSADKENYYVKRINKNRIRLCAILENWQEGDRLLAKTELVDPDNERSLQHVIFYLKRHNKYDEAKNLLKDTLSTRYDNGVRKLPVPDTSQRCMQLGTLAVECLETDKGLEFFSKALVLVEREVHREIRKASIEENIANALKRAGRIDQLEPHLKKSYDLYKGPSPHLYFSRNDLAWCYRRKGKIAEAVRLFEEGCNDRHQNYGHVFGPTFYSAIFHSCFFLGNHYALQGDTRNAEFYFNEFGSLNLGDTGAWLEPLHCIIELGRAVMLVEQGDDTNAEAALKRCVSFAEIALDKDSLLWKQIHILYKELLLRKGDNAGADLMERRANEFPLVLNGVEDWHFFGYINKAPKGSQMPILVEWK